MSTIDQNLLEETSELLDDLMPVLQSSIDSLQQEIDRQEGLLLKAEDVNDRLLSHLNPTEEESTENESQEDITQQVIRQDYPLAVTMSNGEQIRLKKGSWTLAKVIEWIGFEKVMGLRMTSNGVPLVHPRRLRRSTQTKLGKYFIASRSSTAEKKELIEEIARRLNVQLEVEQLNIKYEEA